MLDVPICYFHAILPSQSSIVNIEYHFKKGLREIIILQPAGSGWVDSLTYMFVFHNLFWNKSLSRLYQWIIETIVSETILVLCRVLLL